MTWHFSGYPEFRGAESSKWAGMDERAIGGARDARVCVGWGRRPQRHSGGGGPAHKAATRVAASTPPPSI